VTDQDFLHLKKLFYLNSGSIACLFSCQAASNNHIRHVFSLFFSTFDKSNSLFLSIRGKKRITDSYFAFMYIVLEVLVDLKLPNQLVSTVCLFDLSATRLLVWQFNHRTPDSSSGWGFLCGVCMFSLCMHGFSTGTPMCLLG